MKPFAALAFAAAASIAVSSALATTAAAAPTEKSHFAFTVPKGWSDKSPGDRSYFTFAVDEANHLVMQAKVQPGGEPATVALLDKYAQEAEASVARHLPGTDFHVLDKDLMTIGGVPACRFVFDTVPPGSENEPIRQLQYYVPAGGQHAVLTFTAPRATFVKFLPVFEQAARATVVKK